MSTALARRPASAWRLVLSSKLLAPLLALIGLLIVWEFFVRVGSMPAYLLPAPTSILAYTVDHLGVLIPYARDTTLETLLGFGISVVFGIVASMAIVWSPLFEDSVYPLVVMTQVIPKVAIAPLLIIYLGYELEAKVFLSFLISFFPMMINTTLGMKSVSPELLELLATLKATRWQVMAKIRFRRAIPYMVEGAKIAITLAVIGAIVGEFTAGSDGLGYVILSASSQFDSLQAYSALFLLIVVGVVLFEIVHLGGERLMPAHLRSSR